MSRADSLLIVAALAGACLLSFAMPQLWPVPDLPIAPDRDEAIASARSFLTNQGHDLSGHQAVVSTSFQGHIADHLDRSVGREHTREILKTRFPSLEHIVRFKKPGVPGSWTVVMHPDHGVNGVARHIDEDQEGARVPEGEARDLAKAGLATIGIDIEADWTPRSAMTVDRAGRRDHRFSYSRKVVEEPRIKERLSTRIAGEHLDIIRRAGVVPAEARRGYKAKKAPKRALFSIGALLATIFGFGAFFVFLRELREGDVPIARAAILSGSIFAGILVVLSIQASTFASWDPMEPRWIARLSSVSAAIQKDGWQVILLLAVIGAGDALDRKQAEAGGRRRMASLWKLLSGKWSDPAIAVATTRGVLLALAGAAVLASGTLAIETWGGGRSSLQPRSIFFLVENAASPPFAALLLAFNAALVEEIAYRLFGITWLRSLRFPLWAAVLVPSIVFGLTHATAAFLPLADPWWGRAVVMTAVGIVWGAALVRYDALTLVLGHWFADLVFFQWPRVATGDATILTTTAAVLLVPLIPGLVAGVAWMRARNASSASSPPA